MRKFFFIPVSLTILVWGVMGGMAAAQANTAVDTLNQVDEQGRKQGWWRVVGPVADKPEYGEGILYEEGQYVDNRRAGLWKRYWPTGKPRTEINYVKGFPRGEYTVYYPNGQPEEKGTWDLDRNTGTFKRWHQNGNLAQDFIFDEYGIRDGVQRYYHENGQLEVEVKIVQGREEGTLKRYFNNGELQETAEFNGGDVREGSFRTYHAKGPVAAPKATAEAKPAPAKGREETTNATDFRVEGWNTLYDAQNRLSKQGLFHQGRLWNGKVYKYDGNGILYKIEVYVEGRYVGRAQLTDDDR